MYLDIFHIFVLFFFEFKKIVSNIYININITSFIIFIFIFKKRVNWTVDHNRNWLCFRFDPMGYKENTLTQIKLLKSFH